jgi:iron complex outermembrane receptor protein
MRSFRAFSGRRVGLYAFLVLLPTPGLLVAQGRSATVTGRVLDGETDEPLPGARVFVFGVAQSATARQDGAYRLQVAPGRREIRVSYIGYAIARDTVEVAAGETITRDFRLTREPLALEELAVIGTRATERTSIDAAVPVDVLSAAEIKQSGRTETAQIIQALAPSLNFPRPSVTDGTDHTRPATLRGLAPDQVLVLVNGKRRHSADPAWWI